MPNPWESFSVRRFRAASERGRKMAKRRWELDRERRDAIAKAEESDPLRVQGRIVRRIVVIENEVEVKEIVIRDWDSVREVNRKLARVGLVMKRGGITQ